MIPVSKLVVSVKFALLKFSASLLTSVGLVSKSANVMGTFDGEEFNLYAEIFSNQESLVVFDIGANYGRWSESFLEVFPKTEVTIHSVEPLPFFFEHIKLAGNPKIFPHNFAISENGEVMKIAKVGGGGTSFPDNHPGYVAKEVVWHEIPAMTGDMFSSKVQIGPDLIKIDTDGFDFSVLKSFQNTIKQYSPVVQFEFTFRFAKQAGYSLRSKIKYLKDLDYKTYVVTRESSLRRVYFPRLEVLNHETKNFIALHKSQALKELLAQNKRV